MLRVAAINFLNPAPLMWDFEHAPLAADLATRYSLHYTQPSQCAAELLAGRADLGLIPIASPGAFPRSRLHDCIIGRSAFDSAHRQISTHAQHGEDGL